ncbi:MAG: pentapeptide repeat-containing protein [Crocinitomicaceae bacterium]
MATIDFQIPETNITIKKPVSFGFKLKMSFPDLLNSLGMAIDSLTSFPPRPGSLLKTISSSIKSFSVVKSIEEKAYWLIFTSIKRAAAEVLETHYASFAEKYDAEWFEKSSEIFTKSLDKVPIILDKRFFKNPTKLKFIDQFEKEFQGWLKDSFSIDQNRANRIVADLNDKFIFYLINEYRNNTENYEDVSAALNHDLSDFDLQNTLKNNYRRDLASYYHKPALNEKGITLSDLYVELGFQVHIRCINQSEEKSKFNRPLPIKKGAQKERPTEYRSFPEKIGSNVHSFVNRFLSNDIIEDLPIFAKKLKILAILGYPGQGKTSFCYKLIHDIIIDHKVPNKNIFFIKLKDIVDIHELFSNPGIALKEFLINSSKKKGNNERVIPTADFYNGIWILDGLDELRMKSGISDNKIDQFCKDLASEAHSSTNLKIIITSRHGYFSTSSFNKTEFLVIQLGRMTVLQQKEWLSKYKTKHAEEINLTESDIEVINKNSSISHRAISELIDQPILLHMIATANVKMEEGIKRSTIYERLFTNLIDREWEKGQINALQGIEKESFRHFLQQTALKIFHSDFEYIRKRELLQLPSAKSLLKKLNNQELASSLRKIMISFYFTEVIKDKKDYEDDDGKTAIEFLHKSLQEYLTAEAIWNEFNEFISRTLRRGKKDYYTIDSCNKVIELLSPVIGVERLTPELVQYLREIIDESPDIDVIEISERLVHFLDEMLSIYFYSTEDPAKINGIIPTLNFAYAFLTVLSFCIKKGKGERIVVHSELSRIYNLIIASKLFPPLFFNRFLINEQTNFNFGNFQDTRFFNCEMSSLEFKSVYLLYCDFVDTQIINSTIEDSNLRNSEIHNSLISDSKITNSDLSGVRISKTQIKGCQFDSCTLDEMAVYKESQFSDVFSFSNTTCSAGEFYEILFESGTFINSSFVISDFQRCRFSGVNFEDVDFSGSIFYDTVWNNCSFENVDMEGADFSGAKFKNCNFDEKIFSNAKYFEG